MCTWLILWDRDPRGRLRMDRPWCILVDRVEELAEEDRIEEFTKEDRIEEPTEESS